MMIFQKIILCFWILMLSYKIINLYIEWNLHYTLDYYINYEYSYGFSSWFATNIIFLLTNNHLSHQQFVKKFIKLFVTLAFFFNKIKNNFHNNLIIKTRCEIANGK